MALNTKNKKSSLDEDAYIYTSRNEDDLTEKDKLAGMNKKQKREYFFEYYSKPIIITLLVVGIVGYLFWHDFIAKKDVFYQCAILNETIMDENLETFKNNFTNFCKLDPEKKEPSFNVYYTGALATEVGTVATSDLQAIASRIYAATLDSMIAEKLSFNNYLDNGFFLSMEDFLTPEEYEKLKPYFYIPESKENPDQKAYGIYLTESPVYQEMVQDEFVNVSKPIFGILFNSENKERTRDVLYYLFPDILGEKKAGEN